MAWVARVREFVKDVQVESTKVSWPSRTELRDSTVVVIAAVSIMTVFVWAVDTVLRMTIGLLFQ
jgi:preprotein translocase subunit SecE